MRGLTLVSLLIIFTSLLNVSKSAAVAEIPENFSRVERSEAASQDKKCLKPGQPCFRNKKNPSCQCCGADMYCKCDADMLFWFDLFVNCYCQKHDYPEVYCKWDKDCPSSDSEEKCGKQS